MTDDPVNLDSHRGMTAEKEIEARRLLAAVAEKERLIQKLWDTLEKQMLTAPSTTWQDAVDKATYLLEFFANTPQAQEPHRQRLIVSVLEDFARLAQPRD